MLVALHPIPASDKSLPFSEPSSKDPCVAPFFIEICAGSARVTSCLRHLGMTGSFGVDHKIVKHAGKVLVADLTCKHGQGLFRTWMNSPNLVGIFVAPPCGTCSRARGIPVQLANGVWVAGPQPLRSDQFPNGLRNLSWLNWQRVSSANKLYHFITSICLTSILSVASSFVSKTPVHHYTGKQAFSNLWPNS